MADRNTGIRGSQIKNLTINTEDIINDAISTDKIQNLAINQQKLATNSCSNAKIDSEAITYDKLVRDTDINGIAGNGLEGGHTAKLSIKLDGSSLAKSSSGLKVADGGIAEVKLDIANSPVTDYVLKWNGTKFEWTSAGAGAGDMEKSTYDTDDDGIVDKAENLNDGSSGGGNNVTAVEAKEAVDKAHTQNTDTDLDATFEATFVKKVDNVNVLSDITSPGADIEDAVTKKHTSSGQFNQSISGEIAGITEKTTPVDADVTLIEDSADSNAKKKLSWTNIKATLKTYFDTLYSAVGALVNIVEDTTPQLGGDLDLNGKNIDFPSVANISDVKDEDNMVSDSATMLATQQSIKKYVDDKAKITTGITIDGGGEVLETGYKGFIRIPYACTITKVTLLAEQSGSIVIDIWKDTYANYPPTDADSITASAPPTISSATKSEDSTLSGWTTAISAGDILAFNVDSITDIEKVTLILEVTKT